MTESVVFFSKQDILKCIGCSRTWSMYISHLKCTTLRKRFIQIGHFGLHIQWSPYYVTTLIFYKAAISENKLYIFALNILITSGHPSYKASFSVPQGWPYKRGTTVRYNHLCVLSSHSVLFWEQNGILMI